MSRVFAVMLGFNRPEVIRGAMQNFKDTVAPDHNIVKCFFDPGYPLDDVEANQSLDKQLCSTLVGHTQRSKRGAFYQTGTRSFMSILIWSMAIFFTHLIQMSEWKKKVGCRQW